MRINTICLPQNLDGSRVYLKDLMSEIPCNVVLDKCVAGLGATTLEIKTPRNSIMVEPPRPVIIGKCQSPKHKDDNLFGVYEGVSADEVAEYIDDSRAKQKLLKIMSTPESLPKVIKGIERAGMDWRTDFFWLGDEVQKFTTDVDYRPNLTLFFRYFFEAERKALVSATPLAMSDPRFEEQGFTRFVIQPDYDFSSEIRLITTNSIGPEFASYIEALRDDDRPIMIFTNSTDLPLALIRKFDIAADSACFCSEKSVKKLRVDAKFKCAYDKFELKHMKALNFLTSRFFTAFDIELDTPAHVLMLTDVYAAPQTIIDPYTEAVQIVGRLRNGVASITHITNFNSALHYYSPQEVNDYFVGACTTYKTLTALRDSEANPTIREAYNEVLKLLPFNTFLNPDGSTNHFMLDCHKASEEVKKLYTDPALLCQAYSNLPHFRVSHKHALHPMSDEQRLKVERFGMSKRERQRIIVDILDKLDATDMDQDILRELAEIDSFIVDAYTALGREKLEELKYNQKKIKRELSKISYRTQATSPIVIKQINSHFEVGEWYPVTEIKEFISGLFNEYGVKSYRSVTGTTITMFFVTEEKYGDVNGKKMRGHTLLRSLFATE